MKRALKRFDVLNELDGLCPKESAETTIFVVGREGASSSQARGPEPADDFQAIASEGIFYEVAQGRKLSEPLKQALCKVHCNLGHPSTRDLERFLKLGGVTGETLEALKWMRCST